MSKNKLSGLMAIVFIIAMLLPNTVQLQVNAAASYKFDFGGGAVQSGYIGVSASTAYNRTTGYGFNTPQNIRNVSASGSGVGSDAVQFLTFGVKSTNTFNLDLANGLYEVKVILGDTSRASVAAEGVFQIMNMTGNNAVDSFQVPITDGQLNLLVTEGKVGTAFTLSALEVTKLSDNPDANKTIYIGGDSTVCNYYPLDTSVQAGWGQMFPKHIGSTGYLVRNMATSGQCARGFKDDGQFEMILKYIKPGDVFILQFGINDTAEKNNTTEAQFKEIMREMVVKTKAKGATMVLSAPQGRATDFNSANVHTAVNRWYRNSTVALAKEESVQLIDLNVLSSAYFTSIGPTATLALYMTGDTLHPNRQGAAQLARIVYENLKLPGSPTNTVKPTATPTPTPTNTPTSTSYSVPEDINRDGAINMNDVMLIAAYFNTVTTDNSRKCDLNNDGAINMTDVMLLARKFNTVVTRPSVTPPIATPQSVIYQAELATIYQGIEETINAGYTGNSYVNLNNETGSYVEWNITVPSAGEYSLNFRFANGTTTNRPMEISVNGSVAFASFDFNSTGTWTTWQTTGTKVSLKEGSNIIRSTSVTANGGPNLDYMEVAR